MHIDVVHRTNYRFDRPVSGALQELRLTPEGWGCQRVDEWSIEIDGGVHELSFRDHHANVVHLISLESGVEDATVTCQGSVETVDTNGVVAEERGFAPRWLYLRPTDLTTAGPLLGELVEQLGHASSGDPVHALHALSAHIGERVAYDVGWTTATSTVEEAIACGHGVCQDHTHVFVSAARALGYPARYVSGYLFMDACSAQDATHAWAEAWIDGLGWVGFDVSNGISPDERYVRVAVGLDYREAAPVSGLRFGEGNEILEVALQVQQ